MKINTFFKKRMCNKDVIYKKTPWRKYVKELLHRLNYMKIRGNTFGI